MKKLGREEISSRYPRRNIRIEELRPERIVIIPGKNRNPFGKCISAQI
jgi:hypothetical protein